MSNSNNFDFEGMVKSFFDKNKTSKNGKKVELNYNKSTSNSGALYCMGVVGALVYYMQGAVGFGAVITGILKSFIWPATIIYKLLEQFYGNVT